MANAHGKCKRQMQWINQLVIVAFFLSLSLVSESERENCLEKLTIFPTWRVIIMRFACHLRKFCDFPEFRSSVRAISCCPTVIGFKESEWAKNKAKIVIYVSAAWEARRNKNWAWKSVLRLSRDEKFKENIFAWKRSSLNLIINFLGENIKKLLNYIITYYFIVVMWNYY